MEFFERYLIKLSKNQIKILPYTKNKVIAIDVLNPDTKPIIGEIIVDIDSNSLYIFGDGKKNIDIELSNYEIYLVSEKEPKVNYFRRFSKEELLLFPKGFKDKNIIGFSNEFLGTAIKGKFCYINNKWVIQYTDKSDKNEDVKRKLNIPIENFNNKYCFYADMSQIKMHPKKGEQIIFEENF